jgi:dTDP-4-amino-4,6-dideoxygalactose transaminase
MIKFSDPRQSYKINKANITRSINKTLLSGSYVLGKSVKNFEKQFANYIGARYAVGVNSGTDALEIAIKSLGIRRGDEIITVSHTALATVSAITSIGAIPVLVDVDHSYNIDPVLLSKSLTKRTRAIIVVHLYGKPAPIHKIRKFCKINNLKLIEDCAQACGSSIRRKKIGCFGDISAFSFYPTKNLGTFGDGGAIITSNSKLYINAQRIRQYGWNEKRISDLPGRNSRLDDIHASILSVKLKNLDAENKARLSIANKYNKKLSKLSRDIKLQPLEINETHSFHLYVILLNSKSIRNKLKEYLYKNGIETGIHYPIPIHMQPGYSNLIKIRSGNLKNTEEFSGQILSLPMHPWLKIKEINFIVDKIKIFFEGIHNEKN